MVDGAECVSCDTVAREPPARAPPPTNAGGTHIRHPQHEVAKVVADGRLVGERLCRALQHLPGGGGVSDAVTHACLSGLHAVVARRTTRAPHLEDALRVVVAQPVDVGAVAGDGERGRRRRRYAGVKLALLREHRRVLAARRQDSAQLCDGAPALDGCDVLLRRLPVDGGAARRGHRAVGRGACFARRLLGFESPVGDARDATMTARGLWSAALTRGSPQPAR